MHLLDQWLLHCAMLEVEFAIPALLSEGPFASQCFAALVFHLGIEQHHLMWHFKVALIGRFNADLASAGV